MDPAAAPLWPVAASRQDKARKVRLQGCIMASAASLHNRRSHFTLAWERNETRRYHLLPRLLSAAPLLIFPSGAETTFCPRLFFYMTLFYSESGPDNSLSLSPFSVSGCGSRRASPEFKARARDGKGWDGMSGAPEKASRIFGMTTLSISRKHTNVLTLGPDMACSDVSFRARSEQFGSE